ncbi:MAG: hypothetical protein AB1806_11765 [Acidobacteriota bacterium]
MQGTLPQVGGHIDQMRELILGPHIRESNERFAQCETALRQVGEALRKGLDEVTANVVRLTDNATSSTEKKLRALDVHTGEELISLRQQIERLGETLAARFVKLEGDYQGLCRAEEKSVLRMQSLAEELESVVNALRQELALVDRGAKGELQALRAHLLGEVDRHSRSMRETKVSRDDLADILFEFGMRVKGITPSTAVPQLPVSLSVLEEALPATVLEPERGAREPRGASTPGHRPTKRSKPARTGRRSR